MQCILYVGNHHLYAGTSDQTVKPAGFNGILKFCYTGAKLLLLIRFKNNLRSRLVTLV